MNCLCLNNWEIVFATCRSLADLNSIVVYYAFVSSLHRETVWKRVSSDRDVFQSFSQCAQRDLKSWISFASRDLHNFIAWFNAMQETSFGLATVQSSALGSTAYRSTKRNRIRNTKNQNKHKSPSIYSPRTSDKRMKLFDCSSWKKI